MRLLHVAAGNLFGGVETALVTLARHPDPLLRIEHRFAACFEGRLAQQLRAAGADPVLLGPARVSRPWQVLRARRALRAVVDAAEPDFVAFHGPWALAVLGPAVRPAEVTPVLWAHAPLVGRHWLERLAVRSLPGRIIANSEFTARETRRALPGVPVDVVRCPVAPPPAPRSGRAAAEERASLGIPADAFVVAMVGRLEPLKGHALLLRALERLRDDARWTCIVVGEAQTPAERAHVASLRALAARLGIGARVRFAGFRPDVFAVLRASDVLCQPNVEPDSFGIAVVEALYCGVPVVATDMGGPAEIVTPECGLLVPPDPAALGDGLRALMGNAERLRALGQAAPARAAALCRPEGVADALYAALASDARGRGAAA